MDQLRYMTQGGVLSCKQLECSVREKAARQGPGLRTCWFVSIACRCGRWFFCALSCSEIHTRTRRCIAMTMPKRETNSIWSRVREDVDIDDLIFDYDGNHDENGIIYSERWGLDGSPLGGRLIFCDDCQAQPNTFLKIFEAGSIWKVWSVWERCRAQRAHRIRPLGLLLI